VLSSLEGQFYVIPCCLERSRHLNLVANLLVTSLLLAAVKKRGVWGENRGIQPNCKMPRTLSRASEVGPVGSAVLNQVLCSEKACESCRCSTVPCQIPQVDLLILTRPQYQDREPMLVNIAGNTGSQNLVLGLSTRCPDLNAEIDNSRIEITRGIQ
jgi:hypothetical protein